MKKPNKQGISLAVIALSSLLLSGCSVGMALSGKKDPDLSVLKKGAPRFDVELQLGSAKTITTSPQGNTRVIYEYEVGNEPSAGRAMAHGAMDFLTLGLWEVVGTPVELSTGNKFRLLVDYDKMDCLVSMSRSSA